MSGRLGWYMESQAPRPQKKTKMAKGMGVNFKNPIPNISAFVFEHEQTKFLINYFS